MSLFFRHSALALGALCALACSAESGAGSNTNWLICDTTADCLPSAVCVANTCTTPSSSPCAEGATLSLTSSSATLAARQGSYFADALYVPEDDGTEPQGFVDPVKLSTLHALVRDAAGNPLPGCAVQFLTAPDDGWAFPSATETNDDGTIDAEWVAGSAASETLTAAITDDTLLASSGTWTGQVEPQNAPPLTAASPLSVSPTPVFLAVPLPAGADAVRVSVQPLGAPHQAYFAAAQLPDFYAGLQNTSDSDAFSVSVPADQRLLIASVWNDTGGPASELWADSAVTCAPHEQDAGGIRCQLSDAWQAGDTKQILVEFRSLATGAAAPADYAALGYDLGACTSSVGCTDYTVSLSDLGGTARPLVALRISAPGPSDSFSSYIDPYTPSQDETSCLLTPMYRAQFGFEARSAGIFTAISSAAYSANYSLWSDHPCANHGAHATATGFDLFTGGSALTARPFLPGDTPEPL